MRKQIKYLVVGSHELSEQITSFIDELPFFSIAINCLTFKEMTKLLKIHAMDVVLLDASLPHFTELGILSNMATIIVISDSDKDALKAFEIGATDYLIKPLNVTQFSKAFFRAIKANVTQHSIVFPSEILVKSGRRMEIVHFDTIQYIEAYGMYSKIFQGNGKVLIANSMLIYLEQQLPNKLFLRIHRSFVVNIQKITGFDKRKVYLENKEIELGGVYKAKFNSLFSFLDNTLPN